MLRATFIRAEGEAEKVEPANGQKFTLAEVHHFVGPDIKQLIMLSGEVLMYKPNTLGATLNVQATALAREVAAGDKAHIYGDALVGPKALFVGE